MNRNLRLLAPVLASLLLGGCGSLSRLSEIGRAPAMTRKRCGGDVLRIGS